MMKRERGISQTCSRGTHIHLYRQNNLVIVSADTETNVQQSALHTRLSSHAHVIYLKPKTKIGYKKGVPELQLLFL